VCAVVQTDFRTKGVLHYEKPPQKLRLRPQRALAGYSTSKSGGSTWTVIHAFLSSSLAQVLQLCLTSSCSRHPNPQRSPGSYFSIPQCFVQKFACFRFKFLLSFFRGGGLFWPDGFPTSQRLQHHYSDCRGIDKGSFM